MVDRIIKKKGEWITNHPSTIKGFWPRRYCAYLEGPPRATIEYSVEQLEEQKLVGVYLDEDLEDNYYDLNKCDKPSLYYRWIQGRQHDVICRGACCLGSGCGECEKCKAECEKNALNLYKAAIAACEQLEECRIGNIDYFKLKTHMSNFIPDWETVKK